MWVVVESLLIVTESNQDKEGNARSTKSIEMDVSDSKFNSQDVYSDTRGGIFVGKMSNNDGFV